MKRILIADDHAQTRWILRALIETQDGWEVCAEARDGKEAIEQARTHNPDLVILDQRMPPLDGIFAAEKIHAIMPAIPILLFTLYETEELKDEARKRGVLNVVDKKNAASMLMGSIRSLLNPTSAPI